MFSGRRSVRAGAQGIKSRLFSLFGPLVPCREAWHVRGMNIAVAVSGGMDSLCSLLALRDAGHEVTALHALFLDPPETESPLPALRGLCGTLGINLHVADLRAAFRREVVEPFVAEHELARTPNPCASCNRLMKFGRLLDIALLPPEKGGLGADALATGHYVALEPHPAYGPTLRAGSDTSKDQSYFLSLVPPERLRRCIFPLAERRKEELRVWLAEQGLNAPVPGESQEICFVPRDDHRAFLRECGAKLPGPGPVLLRGKDGTLREIGRHDGLWQYTEGQRRGLGIAWTEPLYVIERDRERNALIVGGASELGSGGCIAEQVNFMVPPALWPDKVLARIRYRQKPAPADVECGEETMRISFRSPQQPPAPGQVAAVYDEQGFVLAGGVIMRETESAPEERRPDGGLL